MPRKNLESRRQYCKEYYAKIRSRVLEKQHAERLRDPEGVSRRQKNQRLRSSYGITLEEYQRMHGAQNGRCAICGEPEVGKQLAVDHDHVTDRVRGLLCQQCNMALGKFRDNPVVLESAIRYLFRARHV